VGAPTRGVRVLLARRPSPECWDPPAHHWIGMLAYVPRGSAVSPVCSVRGGRSIQRQSMRSFEGQIKFQWKMFLVSFNTPSRRRVFGPTPGSIRGLPVTQCRSTKRLLERDRYSDRDTGASTSESSLNSEVHSHGASTMLQAVETLAARGEVIHLRFAGPMVAPRSSAEALPRGHTGLVASPQPVVVADK
jgi:hypothetical protein